MIFLGYCILTAEKEKMSENNNPEKNNPEKITASTQDEFIPVEDQSLAQEIY